MEIMSRLNAKCVDKVPRKFEINRLEIYTTLPYGP